jgi:membrane protease YdiL (CAAX protease family)
MKQDSSLQHVRFVLLFSGCVFLGMSLGAVLTQIVSNALPIGWNRLMLTLAINHLSTYLLPALAYWYWFERARWNNFQTRPVWTIKAIWVAILIVVTLVPFNEIVIDWNKTLWLPKFLDNAERWMLQKEDDKEVMTTKILDINSLHQLIVALIVTALIAAVGEEVFFRGIVQRKLIQGTDNKHLAIWLTAGLFSAIHLQFYGFFPRLLLGGLFGYLYFYSGNLWIPILAHFTNNSLFVLSNVFKQEAVQTSNVVLILPGRWSMPVLSIFLSAVLLFYFRKKNLNSAKIKP